MINSLISFIVNSIIWVFSLLPASPIQSILNRVTPDTDTGKFFGYLNFFIPISEIILVLDTLLGCYLGFLAFKFIMSAINKRSN